MSGKSIKFFNQVSYLLCYPLNLFFVHKLEEEGYSVEIVDNIDKNDETLYFITFGEPNNVPKNYICYNFEYLDVHFVKNYKMYNNAVEVWDYSKKNIQKLKLRTIHKYVPYIPKQYQDIRDIMSEFIKTEKECQYLFYGWRTTKRDRILNFFPFPILKFGRGYEQGLYEQNSSSLWNLLGSTDTVINIHSEEANLYIMEIYRISECELLGAGVVSEPGYMDEEYSFSNLTIVENINRHFSS